MQVFTKKITKHLDGTITSEPAVEITKGHGIEWTVEDDKITTKIDHGINGIARQKDVQKLQGYYDDMIEAHRDQVVTAKSMAIVLNEVVDVNLAMLESIKSNTDKIPEVKRKLEMVSRSMKRIIDMQKSTPSGSGEV